MGSLNKEIWGYIWQTNLIGYVLQFRIGFLANKRKKGVR